MSETGDQFHIRSATVADIEAMAEIAALAWAPIYANYEVLQRRLLGEVVFVRRPEQKADEVRQFCYEHLDQALVTEESGRVVGFITYHVDREGRCGIIGNNGVHPSWSGKGVGTAQVAHVLSLFRQWGLHWAEVVTGLDDAHAPARRMYEKAGFVQVLPSVRYMRLL